MCLMGLYRRRSVFFFISSLSYHVVISASDTTKYIFCIHVLQVIFVLFCCRVKRYYTYYGLLGEKDGDFYKPRVQICNFQLLVHF